jgi:hypothetical protein
VVVLTVALFLVPVLFAYSWVRFAGGRFGWITMLVVFGLFGLATGWLAVPGEWGAARRRAMVGLAGGLGLLGIVTAHFAPATAGRLRHVIEGQAQPAWVLEQDNESGNGGCFDYCTSVFRSYRVEAGDVESLAPLRERFASHGCPNPAGGVDHWGCDLSSGDVRLDVQLYVQPDRAMTVELTATADG